MKILFFNLVLYSSKWCLKTTDTFPPKNLVHSQGHNFALLPGRRQCVGETLARMELFLFTAAITQNFDIQVPDGKEINDALMVTALRRAPIDQEFVYKFRK